MKTVDDKAMDVCRRLNLPDCGPAFSVIRTALREQDRDTRHACSEAVAAISDDVAKANSYRGKVNQVAQFACEMMDRASAACINTKAV